MMLDKNYQSLATFINPLMKQFQKSYKIIILQSTKTQSKIHLDT